MAQGIISEAFSLFLPIVEPSVVSERYHFIGLVMTFVTINHVPENISTMHEMVICASE